jgi:hypothetical protein
MLASPPSINNMGVSQCGLAIYIKKYPKAKVMKVQIFHHAKI